MSDMVTHPQDALAAARAAVVRHGATPDELIPILLDVNERLGYLPTPALEEVGRMLGLPRSRLYAVASFYEMLSVKPQGRHVIKFCDSAPCHVVGGRAVGAALRAALGGLAEGETSPDGRWTLAPTSCLGVCAVGPVMVVDGDVYGNLEPDRLPEILARYP